MAVAPVAVVVAEVVVAVAEAVAVAMAVRCVAGGVNSETAERLR